MRILHLVTGLSIHVHSTVLINYFKKKVWVPLLLPYSYHAKGAFSMILMPSGLSPILVPAMTKHFIRDTHHEAAPHLVNAPLCSIHAIPYS